MKPKDRISLKDFEHYTGKIILVSTSRSKARLYATIQPASSNSISYEVWTNDEIRYVFKDFISAISLYNYLCAGKGEKRDTG